MIPGLSHITLMVRNLERTSALLKAVFDAEQVYSSGEDIFSIAKERFFVIAGVWVCIMEGEPPPERSYHYIAFQACEEDMELFARRIRAAGAEIMPGRARVAGEGHSIYFYDFDNHLFELHAGNLTDRLSRYAQGRPEQT